ncbi:MAG TPA: DUF5680 domain-containing protein [Anaerolineales bacterium]|nr:DUF5680 domain-containing protein [Anaerolineales bacterium]
MDHQELNEFIVQAKSATYVGGGERAAACRPDSHDLSFVRGEWSYLDSYFGGRDFIGEEVAYYRSQAVWAMNYYGRILRADLITPAEAGEVIKASLSAMYKEGRFLGGFSHRHAAFQYTDTSEGEVESFRGQEFISRNGERAYELFYHGGLIKND